MRTKLLTAARIAAYVLLGLFVLVSLPFVVLRFPRGRAALLEVGLDQANQRLPVQVRVARLDRLDPFGLDLQGLVVMDARGALIGRLESLSVRFNPWSLVAGRVHVRRVELARGFVDVAALEQLTATNQKEPEEQTKGESGDASLDIQVDALDVLDLSATLPLGGRTVRARVESLSAAGAYGAQTSLVLSRLDADASDEAGELARLETRHADLDLARGGRVEIAGHIVDAELLLKVSGGPLPEDAALPDGRVTLNVDGVTERTLERLGVDFPLARTLGLSLAARQEEGRAHAALDLHAGKQRVLTLHAVRTPDELSADVNVARTQLDALSPALPALEVEGSIRTELAGAFDDAQLKAVWSRVRVDGQEVPDGRLVGYLTGRAVGLDSLTLAGLERALTARGRYEFEGGATQAEVKLARTDLASLPWLRDQGARGKVALGVDLKVGTDQTLDGYVDVAADGVALATNQVGRGRVKLELQGSTTNPRARGDVAFTSIRAGSVRIDSAYGTLVLRDEQGEASLKVLAPHTALRGDARLRSQSGTRTLLVSSRGTLFDQSLSATVQGTQKPDDSATVHAALSLGAQTIVARADVAANERLVAELEGKAIDLACWRDLLGEPDLAGRIDLHAVAQGASSAPRVALDLAARDVVARGQPATDLDVTARADLAHRSYDAVVGARSDDGLRVDVSGSIVLPERARNTTDYLRGPYRAHARVELPAERLAQIDPERLALAGAATLSLDLEGERERLSADITVDAQLRLPTAQDARTDALALTAHIDEQKAHLVVRADDRDGRLLDATADVTWPNGSLLAATDAAAFRAPPPFALSVALAERRIDELQGIYAYFAGIYDVDVPARVSMKLDLRGDGSEVGGTLRGRAMVLADVLDPTCALGTQVASSFDVGLERGDVRAHVEVRDMHGGTVRVTAEQRIRFGAPEAEELLGPLTVHATGRNLTMRTLPGLCQLSDGRAAFDAQARAFDGKPLTAQLELGVERMRGSRGEPVGLHVTAGLGPDQLEARGEIAVQGAPRGDFSVRTAFTPEPGALVPALGLDTEVEARLALNHMPVSPFLSVGEAVGRPSGHVSARMVVTGPLSDPQPDGSITLEDVSFSLASAAQPLRHLRGRLEVHGREVIIDKLTAGDLDGDLLVNGRAKLDENGTGQGELVLRTNELPLRRQGEVIGELTLAANAKARIPESGKAEVKVTLLDGRIWLTGDQGRNVQSLEPNPDVRFVDEPVDEQDEEETKEPTGEKQLGFAFMTIETERDLWVMHEQFSVQVGLDLRFAQEDGEPVFRGEVALTRGELQILGKLFSLQRGAIRFTGDAPPDPELDIRAVHELPSGKELIVRVTGRGSAPILAFEGAATNAGEAVALLSGVGRTGAEARAQDDARNFATNLTAGLLTVAARREFGDWVPVLGIENDETGAVSGARAGFDATKLIPKALRGFARAAYVEGIVGTGQTSTGASSGVGVGVKVEVVLPADLVTSWGYGPGATWSADVAWAP